MPVSPTEENPGSQEVELEIEDGASAPGPDTPQGEGDNDAGTPAATDEENQPETLLDAVKAAVKKDSAETPSSSEDDQDEEDSEESDSPPAKQGKAPGEEEDDKDPSPEELRGYKPKTRRRIERLLSQRNDLQRQIDDLNPSAEQYRKIETFISNSGLESQEVANGFQVMAMMKNDPARALEVLRPMVAQLEQITGHALPDDLRQKVKSGHMSQQDALELSRARAGQRWTEQQSQVERQRREAREAEDRQRQSIQTMQQAATTWERQWEASDPDYARLQPLVQTAAKADVLEHRNRTGKFPTPDEVRAILDRAKEQVKAATRPSRRPPVQTVREQGESRDSAPVPKTMLEAVKLGAGM